MTAQTKATLKGYFMTNDIPTEAEFADLIDTLPSDSGALYVASAGASAAVLARADYVCDGTADDVQINAAMDALPATGGDVQLVGPTFVLANTVTIHNLCRLRGQGRATVVSGVSGMTAEMFVLGPPNSELSGMQIDAPTSLTSNIIECLDMQDPIENPHMAHGFWLRDLLILHGPNSADYWTINITNPFCALVESIVMRTACNGLRISNEDGRTNYGNSVFNLIEISIGANRTACLIDGSVNPPKNVNFLVFNYLSCVSGSSTGNTGLKILNCATNVFNMPDLEGCATSLYIEGGIGGGAGANGNQFNNIYASNNVVIKSGSYSTVFVAGKILGTITDEITTTRRKTRWLGTTGSDNLQIVDNPDGV